MILGLTGTNGAGKTTISQYLATKYNFISFSTRDFIIKEVQKRGLEVNRDTMRLVGKELHTMHRPGHITRMLLGELIHDNQANVVIESIRSVDAAQFLLSHNAHLWAVDAPQEIRYRRIVARQSVTDAVSFDQFIEQDEYESISDIMRLAEMTFQNDDTRENLYKRIDDALQALNVPMLS